MARQTRPSPRPQSANLTVEQKRAAIPRLLDRVKELQGLDVGTIQSVPDPRITALETRIEQTLAGIFGPGTHEYRNLLNASKLKPILVGLLYFDGDSNPPPGPSPAEIQSGVAERCSTAATMLTEAARTLQEELGPVADVPRGPPRVTSPRGGFDTMQVCTNGHLITDLAHERPHLRKNFCPECGAKTIDACQDCNAPIPGHPRSPGGELYPLSTDVPNYCLECGAAYPWRDAALVNLRLILEAAELDAADTQTARDLLPDLVAETPRSQSAALRMKRILAKMAKPAYDVTIKVMSDLVSETVKKTLGFDQQPPTV